MAIDASRPSCAEVVAKVNHKAVQRLMQLQGLKSLVRPKKYRSYRGQFNANVPKHLRPKVLR